MPTYVTKTSIGGAYLKDGRQAPTPWVGSTTRLSLQMTRRVQIYEAFRKANHDSKYWIQNMTIELGQASPECDAGKDAGETHKVFGPARYVSVHY